MTTALQEFINELKDYKRTTYSDKLAITYLIVKAEKLLQIEKEQIQDAWDAGMSEGIGTTMASLDWDGEFINYYNKTYNNDTNNISSN